MISRQGRPERRHGLIHTLAATFLLLFPLVALANKPVDWSGSWESRWRGGGAQLILEQDGDRVRGIYPVLEGTLEGRIEGKQLKGTWSDPSGYGEFVFSMAPDGQTFMGRFGTGEWWTARRQSPAEAEGFAKDKTSPATALASFLLAANEVVDGRIDRIAYALELLDFSEFDAALTPMQRMQHAITFFRILDRLTFRVWSVQAPNAGSVNELSTELFQAGTGVGFTLRMRQLAPPGAPESWVLVVPTEAEMRAALGRLLEAFGGEMPHARQHHELQSPRDTMRTFLGEWHSWRVAPTDLFLRTMDLSRIPAAIRVEEGALRGQYLKEIIDRIGLVIWQEIPDNLRQRSPYVHFLHPEGSVEIVPVQQADGSWIWQFSAETITSLRPLFMALEDMPRDPRVTRTATGSTPFFVIRNHARSIHRGLLAEVGGVELWQWTILALWLLVSIPVSWLLASLLAWALRLRREGATKGRLSVDTTFIWPLRLVLVTWIGLMILRWLGLPQHVDIPLRATIGVILCVSGAWFLYHLVDKISAMFDTQTRRYGFHDEILRSLLTSIAKLAVIIGAFLLLAGILSIPLAGVIAGLGIGGLAVALAARGTLENFIGGLTLFGDKPIQVGDFCRFGSQLGVVESIGLRSVKVRSLDRTVVTIPNAEFANLHIENFTRRDRIRLFAEIGLRLETTPDQLRWVLAEIRKLLLQHPLVTEEPARARFIGFGDHSVKIEIFAFVATTDWNQFLAVREDIFLRLIDIVEESGTGFAFPSTVNYLARDGGIDDERKQRAEAAMEQLRQDNKLPFPEFDQGTRQAYRDSLDYPPRGSASSSGDRSAEPVDEQLARNT
jgi:small-conductance mechanosensitive channel